MNNRAVLERHVSKLEEEIADLKTALAKAMEVKASRSHADVTTVEVASGLQSKTDNSPGAITLNLDSLVEHSMPHSLTRADCCTMPPGACVPTWVEADKYSTDMGNVDSLLTSDATQETSAIGVDDHVLVHGLSQAKHLNNIIGLVVGYDDTSDRFVIRFAPKLTPSKIRAGNLMFPAVCPYCSAEVTGSQCFACSSGYLLLHESIRPNNSDSMISKSTSNLSSRPLPGPGTRRGTLSTLHINHADSNDWSQHLYSSHAP